MRKAFSLLIVFLLFLAGISCRIDSSAEVPRTPFKSLAGSSWDSSRPYNIIPGWYAIEVLRMVNENRTGLEPTTLNASLMWIAQDYSKYMAETGFYGHVVPSTGDPPYAPSDPGVRMKGVYIYSGGKFGNYSATELAENCDVWSSIDPYANMERWMASKEHHDNIVSPKLVEIGIGAYQASGEAKSCQDFGGGMVKDIDISIIQTDINFNPPNPTPGDSITISAIIRNIGVNDGYPVSISIYDGDPDSGGSQIGNAIDIPMIFINKESITVNATFDTTGKSAGVYPIYIKATLSYPSNDSDIGNNKAFRNLGLGVAVPEYLFSMFPIYTIFVFCGVAIIIKRRYGM